MVEGVCHFNVQKKMNLYGPSGALKYGNQYNMELCVIYEGACSVLFNFSHSFLPK